MLEAVSKIVMPKLETSVGEKNRWNRARFAGYEPPAKKIQPTPKWGQVVRSSGSFNNPFTGLSALRSHLPLTS